MAAEAPALTILDMVFGVISSIGNTTGMLFENMIKLFGQLYVVSASGIGGFILSAVIVVLVLYFVGRFMMGSWKVLVILGAVAVAIIWLILASIAIPI
jgi:hypothetical protein